MMAEAGRDGARPFYNGGEMPKERGKINVRVTPGASRARVEELADGSYKVYVHSKAQKGKANAEAIKLLAGHLGVARSTLTVTRGAGSRDKVVEIG